MTVDQGRSTARHLSRQAGRGQADRGQADRGEIAQLQHALASNRTIGVAIGILVERYQLTPEAAFAFLSRHSQRTNRKVYDLAEELIATGNMPAEKDDSDRSG